MMRISNGNKSVYVQSLVDTEKQNTIHLAAHFALVFIKRMVDCLWGSNFGNETQHPFSKLYGQTIVYAQSAVILNSIIIHQQQ